MALPFLAIFDVIGKVIDRVIPDPAKAMELHLELAKLADQENERAHSEMLGQMETNKVEASSTSMFVAGWRPFIGWTGGIGIAYSFVVEPIASWTARVVFAYTGTFPVLDTGQLMALVMGMLGFGFTRAIEKINGVPDSTPLGKPAPEPLIPTTIAMPKKKRFLPFNIPGIKGI